VTRCDFSTAALAATGHKTRALEPRDHVRLVQADAQRLPFATASFDTVISCCSLLRIAAISWACIAVRARSTPGQARRSRVRPTAWFVQVLGWVGQAGWKVLATDRTVHQFPFLPGRSPLRWQALEANHSLRKRLSPFALTYLLMSRKP
jgi:Methyltransferase domain